MRTILLFTLIFVSCTPFNELSQTSLNPNDLEGRYMNQCDSTTRSSLWTLFNSRHFLCDADLAVELSINEKNKVLGTLYKNDSIVYQKILKGRFKDDGAYYLRRGLMIIPFIPIFYGYSNEKKRIYTLEDELILESSYNAVGGIIFMVAGNKGVDEAHFEKVSASELE